MKNPSSVQAPLTNMSSSETSTVSLYELVKKLQGSLLPQTNSRKSFIVNDIDKSLLVPAEENTLAYIVGNLLSHAVYRTSCCCIWIETVCVAGQHHIRIRNNGAFAFSSYKNSLVHFVDVARKLGGHIGLEKGEKAGVTVVLSMAKIAA